jgi:hypothetical protein
LEPQPVKSVAVNRISDVVLRANTPAVEPSTAIALFTVIGAVAAAASQHADQLYTPTGVRGREIDREAGERLLFECLQDEQQLYCETRLRREVFDELVRFLRIQGLAQDG